MIKKIKTASNIGLWGSLAVAAATIAFVMLSRYRFYMNDRAFNYIMIASIVLTLGHMAVVLTGVRKNVPLLRQNDNLGEKLEGYLALVRRIYYGSLAVMVVLCAAIILSYNTRLIMFALLLVLVLFLSFPNMYKIKVDLGLDDNQMKMLFGDKYIPDQEPDFEDFPEQKQKGK
ncbi:MAG: hypothetical protein MJZ81_09805 [Bacteroidales bacterium]|nr:hypothetical protein [Bacteroidales bacterium]